MNAKTFLIILAAVFFAIDALKIPLRIKWSIGWMPAGFCCLTIALLLI